MGFIDYRNYNERIKMYTIREKEIIFYLEKGYNISEISKVLEISTHTVKAYIVSINRKSKKSN